MISVLPSCPAIIGFILLVTVACSWITDAETSSRWRSARLHRPRGHWNRARLQSGSHLDSKKKPVVYVWATWEHWSTCSRTCSSGVRSRSRVCRVTYPRVTAGSGVRSTYRACLGQSEEYELCNGQNCPEGSLDFRQVQCSHFDLRQVSGHFVEHWTAQEGGSGNQCELSCLAEPQHFAYSFGKAKDGTRCNRKGPAVCVNGRCLPLGCDGVIGSRRKVDMCGVCGGRNATCLRYSSVVFAAEGSSGDQPASINSKRRLDRRRLTAKLGYNEVVRVPSGAAHIRVHDDSNNYLALMDARNNYIINGNWIIDWPGQFPAAGTSFMYNRTETNQESFFAPGPTQEDVQVMVLLRDPSPNSGIYYEYWMPRKRGHPESPSPADTNSSPHRGNRLPEDSATPPPYCPAKCKRTKNRRKHFCQSNFVFRCEVIRVERVRWETRYEVQVIQSYKNTQNLQPREFLWSRSLCRCPRMVAGKEYIAMVKAERLSRGKELRLILTEDSFVRRYTPENDRRILRIRMDEKKFCKKWKS